MKVNKFKETALYRFAVVVFVFLFIGIEIVGILVATGINDNRNSYTYKHIRNFKEDLVVLSDEEVLEKYKVELTSQRRKTATETLADIRVIGSKDLYLTEKQLLLLKNLSGTGISFTEDQKSIIEAVGGLTWISNALNEKNLNITRWTPQNLSADQVSYILYGNKSPEEIWALRQNLRIQQSETQADILGSQIANIDRFVANRYNIVQKYESLPQYSYVIKNEDLLKNISNQVFLSDDEKLELFLQNDKSGITNENWFRFVDIFISIEIYLLSIVIATVLFWLIYKVVFYIFTGSKLTNFSQEKLILHKLTKYLGKK